jgi:hypothetical protein
MSSHDKFLVSGGATDGRHAMWSIFDGLHCIEAPMIGNARW